MIFSRANSFDNSLTYNSNTQTLPFYGLYESVIGKKTIYIYCKTSRNDTLTIQFSNNNSNDSSNFITSETYNINNTEKKIIITPKLNYFRIYLTSTTSYNNADTRIYNVYSSDTQILLTDTDGNLLTTASGSGVSSNVEVVNTPTVTFSASQYDAFGRFRTSQPFTLFDSSNVNYKNAKFSEYTTGGGTTSYNYNASTISLICNSSGSVIREGKTICSYQPGKSLLILNTFVMNSNVFGLTQRVGYYNDKNGIYLELDSSGNINFVKRSNVSGSVVETSASQSSWNTNTLLSGSVILDLTKPQILWIDIEWLGVGSVRCGFVIDSIYHICHIFKHANDPAGSSTYGTYMTSARLSPRYEISYSGAGSGLGYTLKQICSSVVSEGGYDSTSIIRHVGNTTNISSFPSTETFMPMISIKLDDASGNSSVGINSIVIPSQCDILYLTSNGNGSVYFQLLLNPTITPTPSYTSYQGTYPQDTTSGVSYWVNTSGSNYNISGGIIVNSGFLTNNSVAILSSPKDFNLQIGRTYTGNNTYTSDKLVLSVMLLTTGNSQKLFTQLGWYEV
jgi:hypothetical protein